jgi:hypothetical protein
VLQPPPACRRSRRLNATKLLLLLVLLAPLVGRAAPLTLPLAAPLHT